MANSIYIACSIDGFIGKKDGNIDWLINIPNENNSDYGFGEFIKRIDGMIMGRRTFEKIMEMNLKEWPYTKPVFVLSSTLKNVPDNLQGKAEIVHGNINEIVSILNNRGINNIYIDGGKTIQSFLKNDLIDEMIISVISILLGEGIPLFGEIRREIPFALEKSEYIDKNIVMHYYRKIKSL
jgi:dihydrofolate reductase